MSKPLLDIWENIYVGLVGAGLSALLIKALSLYRELRLKRKYPIAGSYVSWFEDEVEGRQFIARSKVDIAQRGLSVVGKNYIEGGKTWNLEGQISELGYVSGIYFADLPYDPGNGTFFLKIDGVDLDGLWSGYDSVNRSLQGGKYWFRRTPKMQIVNVSDKYRSAALSIADQTLGAGYLNDLADGDGLHQAGSIIAVVDDSVLGFATFSVEAQGYLQSSEKLARVKFPVDLRSSDKAGLLGTLGSWA